MKAIRTKNRIKAVAVSFAICLALIFSTIFTFGYDGKAISAAARAAGDGENGIRFVQVAAGEDFAIGLTYDGRLFGWSLVNNTTRNENANSLGRYYTSTPTQIPVKFRMGPSGSTRNDWSANAQAYHAERPSDRIVSIATTSTTAAFITASGYIYTWGLDSVKDLNEGYKQIGINPLTNYRYLLLRPYEDADARDARWYEPYIINYNYYGSTDRYGLYNAYPQGTTFSEMTLAGGENNYILVYRDNNASAYYSYVWGSLLYAPLQRDASGYTAKYSMENDFGGTGFNIDDNSENFRRLFKTQYVVSSAGIPGVGINTSAGGTVTAVAGGYTVGMNASNLPEGGAASGTAGSYNTTRITSLSLKGKNFITTSDMDWDSDSNTLTPVATVKTNAVNYGQIGEETIGLTDGLSNMQFQGNTIEDGIIGAYYSIGSLTDNGIQGTRVIEMKWADLYYARQASAASGETNIIYSVDQQAVNTSGIVDAYGAALDGTQDKVVASIIRNAVSLGNDIGYGISSTNGTLYAWGDNAYGQSGKGTSAAYYQYPTPTLEGKGPFMSVAAGRQLSPGADRKAFNYAGTLGSESDNKYSFNDDVKNDTKYISGALTKDGKLYVWSDSQTDPKEIVFGLSNDNATDNKQNVNSNNRFAAVYSGYGRNLFAITKLGRVVRITCDGEAGADDGKFYQEIYDSFNETSKEGTVTAMTNWSVESYAIADTAKKSTIKFTIPTADQPTKQNRNPSIGAITLYVDDALATKTSVSLNGVFAHQEGDAESPQMAPMTYGGKARESLVSTNAVGDVYRILDPDKDAGIEYMTWTTSANDAAPAGTPSNKQLSKEELTPKFSFKAKGSNTFEIMDEDQWKQLFGYKFVTDNKFGVGIEITPIRSTQSGTVNMSFYVARYDNSEGDALYYDHLECNVEFSVDNSTVVRMYEAFDSTNSNKSAIPLLDPSNDANKYYSLAVQNASAGFTELAKFIAGGSSDELVNKIVKYITTSKNEDLSGTSLTWDPGFPDKAKIEKGNLKYYLGENVENLWYSGSYKYLFEDRDLDVIRLTNIISSNNSNTAIAYGAKTVTVRLTGLAELKIPYDDGIVTRINKNFANTYGLMNINVTPGTEDDSEYVDGLEFAYDILLFTANGTTGAIEYGDNPTVDSFNTIKGGTSYLTYSLAYEEYVVANQNFTTKVTGATDADKVRSAQNWVEAASVFSQPSVRLNSRYTSDDGTNSIIYGATKATAEKYGLKPYNHLEVLYDREYTVGGDNVVINLSEFIQASGTYVTFSHENSNINFKAFNDQFVDSLTGENYVTLDQNRITVKFISAHPIRFTVTIQRFFGRDGVSYFTNGDEKVTITFAFVNVKQVPFTEPATSSQEQRTYDLSREMNFYIFGRNEAPIEERVNVVDSLSLVSLANQYRNKMTLDDLTSSNYDVVTPTKLSNSVLRLTPKESGKAIVQFTLSAFSQSIPITLTFNVSGETTIKDQDQEGNEIDYVVNLDNASRVYMSTLTTGLRNAVGNFIDVDSFTPIFDDKRTITEGTKSYEKYEAVEFARVDGIEMDSYKPAYVSRIGFYDTNTSKTYLRLDIDSDATAEQLDIEYYVSVKFVAKSGNYSSYEAATGDTILRAVFRLKANKKVAFVSGSMLEIKVDVDKPYKGKEFNKNEDWYMTGSNTEAKVYVPLQYLCEAANILDYDNYEIFLVTTPEGSAKYINPVGGTEATRDVVEITPLKNTVAPITLNVSIMNPTVGQSGNLVVAFSVSVTGISEVLSKEEYIQIWLVAFFASFGVLLVIFLIRLLVYWRRRAKQRALVKRNQELIKMRDRAHNKATSATREQALKTKLKLQDSKYAKVFNEMKKEQNGGIGVAAVSTMGATVSDDFGTGAGADDKKKKKKGGKGGKKSMAELKAELAAKKAAFAQAQNGGGPAPVDPAVFTGAANPFNDMPGGPFGVPGQSFSVPGQGGFGAPGPDFGAPPQGGFGAPGPDFGAPPQGGFGAPGPDFGALGPDFGGGFAPPPVDANTIVFDAPDMNGQG
ncbi:MAG: hypothetical protein J1G38_05180 [Clostridiales bacterium]|nr:hypothetical protein [Clostridiales bacterium]